MAGRGLLMFEKLRHRRAEGINLWFFAVAVIFMTWLANFLVGKTLEATKQITSEISSVSPQEDKQGFHNPKALSAFPIQSTETSLPENDKPQLSHPKGSEQQPKEIIYEPSIKENILLQ